VAPSPAPAAETAPAAGTAPATETAPAPSKKVFRPFTLDPVLDPALALFAFGAAGGAQIVIQSGALDVPIPGSIEDLPSIDRNAALNAYNNPTETDTANLTLAITGAVALGSSVATWVRDDWKEGAMDLAMYSETLIFNFTLNNIVKLAVRRPRPRAYANWHENVADENGNWDPNDPAFVEYQRDTEQGLSFYSMHTATVSSLWATATYIAFVRDYNPVEKWVIMSVGAIATLSVAAERIASLDHFPTDVIAGGLAGISTGVIVPHLHRNHNVRFSTEIPEEGGGIVAIEMPWTW
jgi:undecaprenyl-diphosphatase